MPANLRWTDPPNGGSPITGWSVRRTRSGTTTPVTPTGVLDAPITLSGVTYRWSWTDSAAVSGDTYTVAAVNSVGTGAYSSPAVTFTSAVSVGAGSWYDPQVQTAGLANFSAITPNATNGGPGPAVTVVDDPLGVLLSGTSNVRKVIRFAVTETTGTYVTGNPRAQVEGANILNATDKSDVYFGFSLMFPTNSGTLTGTFFPNELPLASAVGHTPGDHFFTFAEVYGPPYGGGSPWKLTMANDDTMIFQPPVSALGSYAKVWRLPPGAVIPRNQWLDFVWHEKLSTSSTVGFAEVWLNTGSGYTKLVYTDGSKRLYLATLDSTNWNGTGPDHLKLASYRGSRMHGAGVDSTYTHYAVAQRYGPSFASVDPSTYAAPVTTPPA